MELHQAGRVEEAEAGYRAILEQHPDDPHALHFLGLIALQQDELQQADELIARAVALLPDEPVFLCNLGQAKKKLGQLPQAEAAYHQALKLAPRLYQAWHNLALLYESMGDDARAIPCYQSARTAKPGKAAYAGDENLVAALQRHGRALLESGQAAAAVELFRQATAIAPTDAAAWSGFASSLTLAGKPLQAMPAFDRALALQPGAAHLYNNRANAQRDAGQLEAAIADYQQALKLDPGYRDAWSNLLFTHLSLATDPATLARLQQQAATSFAPAQPLPPPVTPHGTPTRIAIVSADLRQHPVAWFMLAWFELRDRSAFHLTLYASSPRQDTITERIRSCCDAWVECAELGDEALAARIREDRIELLIDLAGHTADNRLGVFALRPAPRQATFLGYAGSTGLSCFDARIADWITEPEGAEACSSEPLLRLDSCYFCYTAPALDLPPAPPPFLKNRHITFGCSSQLAKVTDATLSLWAEVLRAVPRSRLLLRSMTLDDPLLRKRLMARMAKAGLDTQRVRLDGPRPLPAHLAAWQDMDITLDTTPFNLATQSCESLWMGVPVVTLQGDRHAGRLGASILTASGLSDLVVQEPAQYVQRAAELAQDGERLQALRSDLREQLQSAGRLCDREGFARRLDQALATIAALRCCQ